MYSILNYGETQSEQQNTGALKWRLKMARLKGGLIESNFDLSKRAPLDARELVTKYEDLINPSVWQISGTTFETLYNGLTVSVSEVGPNMGKYFLLDRKAVTPENYNAYL